MFKVLGIYNFGSCMQQKLTFRFHGTKLAAIGIFRWPLPGHKKNLLQFLQKLYRKNELKRKFCNKNVELKSLVEVTVFQRKVLLAWACSLLSMCGIFNLPFITYKRTNYRTVLSHQLKFNLYRRNKGQFQL